MVSLALSHLVVIAFAIALKWRLENVVWIYWYGGLVAGGFAFLRMLRLPTLGPAGVVIFGLPFLMFHLFYFAFFALAGNPPRVNAGIAISVLGMVISHALSFRRVAARDKTSPPDIEHFCGFAGARMLPVMATVALALVFEARSGAASTHQLLVFLVIAAIADVGMQAKEHSLGQSPGARNSNAEIRSDSS